MLTSSPMPYHNMLYKFFHSPQTKSLLTQKMQSHFLTNAIFEPNTASNLAVQILTYLKQYAPFCPAIFSLSLAQILRLPRKIKTKCIFGLTAKTHPATLTSGKANS